MMSWAALDRLAMFQDAAARVACISTWHLSAIVRRSVGAGPDTAARLAKAAHVLMDERFVSVIFGALAVIRIGGAAQQAGLLPC